LTITTLYRARYTICAGPGPGPDGLLLSCFNNERHSPPRHVHVETVFHQLAARTLARRRRALSSRFILMYSSVCRFVPSLLRFMFLSHTAHCSLLFATTTMAFSSSSLLLLLLLLLFLICLCLSWAFLFICNLLRTSDPELRIQILLHAPCCVVPYLLRRSFVRPRRLIFIH